MKILEQTAVIFGIYCLSVMISSVVPINLPASITSMVLLFLLLVYKVIKVEQMADVADYLLKNMAFFFIPAGVGIIQYFDLLRENAFVIVFICVITTFITFFTTALAVSWVIKLMKRGHVHGTTHK